MGFTATFRQGWKDARAKDRERLDHKHTKKALRRNPQAEWLYTAVRLKSDANDLLACGWEFVDRQVDTFAFGPEATAVFHLTALRKRNPALTGSTASP